MGLEQPKPAEAGGEAAVAQVSEEAEREERVETAGGAAAEAGAEHEGDAEMGEEEDDEEALNGVPPDVLGGGGTPSVIDMELYAAALEGAASGKKSTGRNSSGKKTGPAGAGGKQPPTPVPMGAKNAITKIRIQRDKHKGQ